MAFARVCSRTLAGVEALQVQVEVHMTNGIPQFILVGLPDTEVRESRERVRAAIVNSGFRFPVQRITVNLAPADLPKQSGSFDLPIALGILAASGQLVESELSELEFVGELALSGELRAIRGVLPIVLAAERSGHGVVFPAENACEAAFSGLSRLFPARHLRQVCSHLAREERLSSLSTCHESRDPIHPDMKDVFGQHVARRVMEVAAAGCHHLLLVGTPGTGKSMLARCFPGICPPMTHQEAMESAVIHSMSPGGSQQWGSRPYRAPHHSLTVAAMVGGGRKSMPGEVSLAHAGILHLDEMGEFSTATLEALREPMETGRISLSREARKITYPARFQLVGTMNPCPCGYLGHVSARCHCSPEQVARYARKVSGPLLDRVDLRVEVPMPDEDDWERISSRSESSQDIRQRVGQAVLRQLGRQGQPNGHLEGSVLQHHAPLGSTEKTFLMQAMKRFHLSIRALHRTWRVAMTIADLDGEERVRLPALGEALRYRGIWPDVD